MVLQVKSALITSQLMLKIGGVFFDARYAQISPEVEIKGVTTFDLDIDPMVYTIGYSYKF